MKQILMEMLFELALLEGQMAPQADIFLKEVSSLLVGSESLYHSVAIRFFQQSTWQTQGKKSSSRDYQGQRYQQQRAPVQDSVQDAYRILGVTAGHTDKEIKRAYRKLMSEHHPDKLMAKGLPPEMIKIATEKSQEIQKAWSIVQKTRNIK